MPLWGVFLCLFDVIIWPFQKVFFSVDVILLSYQFQLLVRLPPEESKSFFNKKNFLVKDVIEKPNIKSAPSNYAVIGRYILPTKIFKILKKQKPGENGEIHITDAIRTLIHQNNKFISHVFAGKYLDCGTMRGYVESSTEISKL